MTDHKDTPLGPHHSRAGMEARITALEDQVRELRRMVWTLALGAAGLGSVGGAAVSSLLGGS